MRTTLSLFLCVVFVLPVNTSPLKAQAVENTNKTRVYIEADFRNVFTPDNESRYIRLQIGGHKTNGVSAGISFDYLLKSYHKESFGIAPAAFIEADSNTGTEDPDDRIVDLQFFIGPHIEYIRTINKHLDWKVKLLGGFGFADYVQKSYPYRTGSDFLKGYEIESGVGVWFSQYVQLKISGGWMGGNVAGKTVSMPSFNIGLRVTR